MPDVGGSENPLRCQLPRRPARYLYTITTAQPRCRFPEPTLRNPYRFRPALARGPLSTWTSRRNPHPDVPHKYPMYWRAHDAKQTRQCKYDPRPTQFTPPQIPHATVLSLCLHLLSWLGRLGSTKSATKDAVHEAARPTCGDRLASPRLRAQEHAGLGQAAATVRVANWQLRGAAMLVVVAAGSLRHRAAAPLQSTERATAQGGISIWIKPIKCYMLTHSRSGLPV
jgi:hypothetical protein